MDIHSISLFSGVGGLDIGLSIAFPRIRWVCHVEREAYAAAVLTSRMEDETLDAAPVWSDVTTFDGKPWRGKVDLIAGGFPCTDLSVAGKLAGINGEASGLWWEFARIIREVQPRWIAIENVPAVISVEPARAVLGELATIGFDAEWITLRASDAGAPHQRKRVFILAHCNSGGCGELRIAEERLSDADTSGAAVGDAKSNGFEPCGRSRHVEIQRSNGQKNTNDRSSKMANTCKPGSQGNEQNQLSGSSRDNEGRTAAELCRAPFPPGPSNTDDWRTIVETAPELAPALEPAVRGMVNEFSKALDERRNRLRATGNGVVPLQAAVAFTALARRMECIAS